MSLIFEQGDIVDRANETNKIEQIIKQCVKDVASHAIIIWADSGYGKSAIMGKVKSIFEGRPVRVAIAETPPSNNATSTEGQYLCYIAEAIDHTLKEQFSLENFLYSPASNIQPLVDADSILTGGYSAPSAIAAQIGMSSLKSLKAQRLFYNTDVDSILVLKNYIEAAMRMTYVVVDIPNAQNIDATSFRIINGILQSQDKAIIIFEFTTNDGSPTDVYRFASSLHCPYTLIEVDQLPFDFALSIIGIPGDQNKIYEIERFYRDVIKGNLYKIMQAKNDHGENNIPYDVDPIESKIQNLGYSSKLLLVIICLHDGKIDNFTFDAILSEIKGSFYISDTWTQELNSLLYREDDQICLRHASIADSLQLSYGSAAAISAYHYLSHFYESMKTSESSAAMKNQAVIQLVKLYSRFEPIRMIPLLDEFKQVLIEKLSESDALIIIRQAFDALGQKVETEYHFRLIALCYEAGFYSGALELLNDLGELKTECGKTYRCMLLNRNDYHRKAIIECMNLEKTVKNPRYRLILGMIKMLSERSLNDARSYYITFQEINKKLDYRNLLEYGFFLRNTQIVFSYQKSLPYLKRSIEFFEKRGEEKYMAHSELTYIIQSARLGYLDISAERLDKITPILLQTSFEKHIVYLNQAAIRLLNGQADGRTRNLLDKALITATTVFDRLVILNNILCSLIISSVASDEFGSLLEKLVFEARREPDLRICKKAYTNIFLYYQMVGDKINATYWKNEAIKILPKEKTRSIENVFLFNEEPSEDLRFLSTQPCCVCFISYWHFDIPILDL